MKRTTIVISILVAMSMLFTACAPKTSVITDFPRNETLYITGAAWGPPSTWNPFQPGSLANTTGTIGLLYETLFGFRPDDRRNDSAACGKWQLERRNNL